LRGFVIVVVVMVVVFVVFVVFVMFVVFVVVLVAVAVVGAERTAISNMRAYECIIAVDTYTVYIFISF